MTDDVYAWLRRMCHWRCDTCGATLTPRPDRRQGGPCTVVARGGTGDPCTGTLNRDGVLPWEKKIVDLSPYIDGDDHA